MWYTLLEKGNQQEFKMLTDASGVEGGVPKKVEVKTIVGEKLPKCITTYAGCLRQDNDDTKGSELSGKNLDELEEHEAQLKILETFLKEYGGNRLGFESQIRKQFEGEGRCAAGLKREKDPPIGNGEKNAQIQLNFLVQGFQPETSDEAISALSLRNTPHEAMERLNRQMMNGSILINTVRVFKNEMGKVIVMPQAGIQISRSAKGISVSGVKFVGTRAHYDELDNREASFASGEYRALEKHISQLSRNGPSQRR